MSLRLRFFIVVWLLVVVGLVTLGAVLGRFSIAEIGRVSIAVQVEQHLDAVRERLTTELGRAPTADSISVTRTLEAEVGRDSLLRGAMLVDSVGGVLGSAFPVGGHASLTFQPDHSFLLRWVRDSANQRSEIAVRGTVVPLGPRDQRFLILIPAGGPMSLDVNASAERHAGNTLVSRITLVVLAGSVLAALVTFAISGPLLGRVGELSRATALLGQGERGVRVAVRGADEVAELGHRFNAMAGDLERSEEQRRQMVTDVAHELRTPLTNITGLLEAVEDGLRVPDAELVAVLQEEAGLLARLIDDLRDLSLADAGELVLQLEPVPIGPVVRAAVESFRGRHDIAVELPPNGAVAQADSQRLGQVLRNLIQNAVTHSPVPGSVSIVVVPGVEVIRIEVTDHGHGIQPEELDRIWERFYRVDRSRDRATGGMGLGLPVSRRLVEAMGGTIEVESRVGEGTRFVVGLPLAK